MPGNKRGTLWEDTIRLDPILEAAEQINRLTPAGFNPGHTLTRTIIHMAMYPSVKSAVEGMQRVWFGIGICSEDAFNVGAVPNPSVSGESPPRGWVIRDFVIVEDAPTQVEQTVKNVHLDLGPQRKLDDGVLYMVLENNSVQGTTFSVDVQSLIRLLCLLP